MKSPLFLSFLLGLGNLPALAADSDVALNSEPATACTEFHVRHGSFHYQRFEANDGACFLSADPFDVGDFRYRSYLVTNEGLLMVFNSYSASDAPAATGARVFHFFPRNQTPSIEAQDGQVKLQTSSQGISLLLSQDQTSIVGMEGGKVSEITNVHPTNFGGVEIKKANTLYLDSGFAQGHDVTTNGEKKSTFHDHRGRSCEVTNKEVFRYTSDGDSHFKFTDGELKNYLKTRCPRLKVNF